MAQMAGGSTRLLFWHQARFRRRYRSGRRGGALTGILSRPKTELDDGARIGNEFRLPAVVTLEFLHGGFGSGVPMTRGFACEITRFDQRRLNLGRTGVVDSALS